MGRAEGLRFVDLRAANTARLPEFRNRQGEVAHYKADGSDWSLNDWMTAVCGEMGEAANVLKKVRRGDFSLAEARPKLVQEFADVVIYLDIMAKQAGIDLGDAVAETFNAKSVQVGSSVRLAAGGASELLAFAQHRGECDVRFAKPCSCGYENVMRRVHAD